MSFSVAWSIVAIDKFTQIADKIKSSADKMGEQFEKLNKKVEKTNKTVDKSANSLNRLGEAQNRVNRIFAIGSAIMGGVALKTASDIEKAFNNTQSILQLPAQEFIKLKENAKKMSLSLGASMTDVAKAMENFGGVTEDELSKVRTAITVSKATGQSMSDMISPFYDTVTAMKLTGEEAVAFGDKLSYINTVSNKVDLSVISRALSKGAPALLRHSDDMNSLLGIVVGLGEAGIETGNATRFMWKAQTSLLKPSKKIKESLDSLQVSVGKSLFTDKGKLKPLADVADIIMEAKSKIQVSGDKTKEQAFDEFLLNAFGPQAANILKSINEERLNIAKYTTELSKAAGGYAQKMAMIKEQGFGAEVTKVGIAMQGLFDTIFDDNAKKALADIVRNIREMTIGLIQFLDKNPQIKKLAQALIVVGGVVLPLVASFMALGRVLKTISVAGAVLARWPLLAAITTLSLEVENLIKNWGSLEKIIAGSPLVSIATKPVESVVDKIMEWAGFPSSEADVAASNFKAGPLNLPLTRPEIRNELSLDINIKDRDNYVESVKTTTSNTPGFNLGRNLVTVGR